MFVADREAYRVEVYARVRRAVQVDGMSIRQKDREFGPVRRRPGRCRGFSMPLGLLAEEVGRAAKLGPQLGIIDQIPADGAVNYLLTITADAPAREARPLERQPPRSAHQAQTDNRDAAKGWL